MQQNIYPTGFWRCIIRPEDARYILNIRPSSTKGQDTLIWNYTTMGEYTVKSGYHMYNQMQKQYRSEGQESREMSVELNHMVS